MARPLSLAQRTLLQCLAHDLLGHCGQRFFVGELFFCVVKVTMEHQIKLAHWYSNHGTIEHCLGNCGTLSTRPYPATLTLLHLGPLGLYPLDLHLEKDKDTLGHACSLVHLVLILAQMSDNLANCSS